MTKNLWAGDNIGGTGTKRLITDPRAWVNGTRQNINRIYTWDGGQRRLVYARETMTISITNNSNTQQTVNWTGPAGPVGSYTVRNSADTVTYGTVAGSTLKLSRSGLAASTNYGYLVSAHEGPTTAQGPRIAQITGSATTPAAPLITKEVTLNATWSQTYKSTGGTRNDSSGNAYMYSGGYSSTWGAYLPSLWGFNVPADVKNCVRIDSLKMSVYNIHAYYSTVTLSLVCHTNATKPANYTGATGQWATYTGGKPAYVGGGASRVFVDLTNVKVASGDTIVNHFRAGAKGLGWGPAPSTSYNYWGYSQGASGTTIPQLYIKYTVSG